MTVCFLFAIHSTREYPTKPQRKKKDMGDGKEVKVEEDASGIKRQKHTNRESLDKQPEIPLFVGVCHIQKQKDVLFYRFYRDSL